MTLPVLRAFATVVTLWALAIGLISLEALGASPPNSAIRLTLDKSIRIALTSATQVLKSQNALDLSGEAVLRSYAQFLPKIDATAGPSYGWGNQFYTFTGPLLVNSKSLSAQFELSTNLNLFNGLSDLSNFNVALLNQDAAAMTLERAKQQIATDVTQSYYQIILDRELLDIDNKNLAVMLNRERLLNTEFEVGNASAADAAQQSSQATLASSVVIGASQKLRDDEILLIQKLRLDPKLDYEFEDLGPSFGDLASLPTSLPDPREGESGMIKTALDLRPDLGSSLSLSKSAEDAVTAARGDYYPKLDLGFNMTGNGATIYNLYINGANQLPAAQESLIPQIGNQINYAVSLTLSWNILDFGLTRYGVAQARTAAENSEIDYEDAKIAVVSQIRQVEGDYNSARTALIAARKATLAAKKAYHVISGRYKVGASSFVDLITAQAALVQAQSLEAQARIALEFQWKLAAFYEGKTPTR